MSEPNCPNCSGPMTLRTARSGPNAGNQFWGCKSYPKCKGTRDLTSEQAEQVRDNPRSASRSSPTDTVYDEFGMRPAPPPATLQTPPIEMGIPAHRDTSVVWCFESRGAWNHGESATSFRNWGLELRAGATALNDDRERAFLSTLDKILHRGRAVPLPAELRALRGIYESLSVQAAGLGQANPDAFQYGSPEERRLAELVARTRPGLLVCPQYPLDAISGDSRWQGNRVDFLLQSDIEKLVVEVDGSQHEDPDQATLDEERREAAREGGIPTQSIRTADLPGFHVEGLEIGGECWELLDAAQVCHAILTSIALALRVGDLDRTAERWTVSVTPPGSELAWEGLCQSAVESARSAIQALSSIYGLKSPPPVEVSILGAVLADRPVVPGGELSIHFTQVPPGELPRAHYYYRELPGEVALRPLTAHTSSLGLVPDREATEYFLRWIFGFSEFRDGQWQGIARSLEGKDSLVLMPTGYGKSLIYQMVAMLRPGNCLVIDPIVSLMDDQAFRLRERGLSRSCALSSQIPAQDRPRLTSYVASGYFQFLFVSPERLQIEDFREALRAHVAHTPISAVVIDEAHCVSEWGHDFRTAYLNIARIAREQTMSEGVVPPLLGLTGTASRSVLKDVKRELDIEAFEAVITPKTFDRPELRYRVIRCHSDEKERILRDYLEKLSDRLGIPRHQFFEIRDRETASGIIFCTHVNGSFGVMHVAQSLGKHLPCRPQIYSGTAPKGIHNTKWNDLKRGAALAFTNNQTPILVSTKAFGMGIDKPNVRYTVHYGLPNSIESFYQEAGRAGRDGKTAICSILFSNDFPDRNRDLLGTNLSIEEIAEAIDEAGFGEADDITRSLFFQKNAFRGQEAEMALVEAVLDQIEDLTKDRKVAVRAEKGRLSDYEKGLHRLLTIGVVRDYTVDYSNNRLSVSIRPFDPELVRKQVESYVGNYQKSRAQILLEQLPDEDTPAREFVLKTCECLTEFIYDTIELGRRRALLEMVQLCAPGTNEETIRKRILSYLERGEFDEALDALVEDQEDPSLITELLEDVVSPNHAQALRGQVIRFLESYPDVPNLLLLRGVIETLVGEPDSEVVEEALTAWIDSATTRFSVSLQTLWQCYAIAMDAFQFQSSALAEHAAAAIIHRTTHTELLRKILEKPKTEAQALHALARLVELHQPQLHQWADKLEEWAE